MSGSISGPDFTLDHDCPDGGALKARCGHNLSAVESVAKHRKQGWYQRWRQRRQWEEPQRRRTIDMVDRETREIHLLPRDAVRDRSTGRFPALCGYRVLPASITDPGRRYCESCLAAAIIPSQRSR